MQADKLTMDDGLMMRILADSPGGLELHIGVSYALFSVAFCLSYWPSPAMA